MCALCSLTSVPVCQSGALCSQAVHQALLVGSVVTSSVAGMTLPSLIKKPMKKEKYEKK